MLRRRAMALSLAPLPRCAAALGGCAAVDCGVGIGNDAWRAARRRSSDTRALREQRRGITRLYTSFYAGELFPSQLVQRPQRLPPGVRASDARARPTCATAATTTTRQQQQQQQDDDERQRTRDEDVTEAVSWHDADSTDLVHVNSNATTAAAAATAAAADTAAAAAASRPYVPLAEVAKLELQGDYLTEGGMHQEALEYYGVVAKAYSLAYPDARHTQRLGIVLKVAGALRRTGRCASSLANIEHVLRTLDTCATVPLELLVEALLEAGLTHEALHDATAAGAAYEDAVAVVRGHHRLGESHRMLRLLPRLGRSLTINMEQKFVYYSPFDYDRTFALVDQCLARAEAVYRQHGPRDGVVRVLQTRKELLDTLFFNMRDFAGRIQTMRGHWMRRARTLTNAPTPDELLRFSPTLHQVYRDFRFELTAPIGRESEVQPGVNRTVLDMGNPHRKDGRLQRRQLRDADYNFAQYTRDKAYGV